MFFQATPELKGYPSLDPVWFRKEPLESRSRPMPRLPYTIVDYERCRVVQGGCWKRFPIQIKQKRQNMFETISIWVKGTACSPAKYSTASKQISMGPTLIIMKVIKCISTEGAPIQARRPRIPVNCREGDKNIVQYANHVFHVSKLNPIWGV